MIRKYIHFFLIVFLWLFSLMMIFSSSLWSWKITFGYGVGWLLLLPFLGTSILLFLHGTILLLTVNDPPIVAGYSVATTIQKLQGQNLFILHLLPLSGAIGGVLILPNFFFRVLALHNPVLLLLYFAIFFLVVSLFLWRGKAGWWRAFLALSAFFVGLFLTGLRGWSLPPFKIFWLHTTLVFLAALIVVGYFSGLLRWWSSRRDFRPFLQRALYLLTFLIVLGVSLRLVLSHEQLVNMVACCLLGGVLLAIIWSFFIVLKAIPILFKKRESLQFSGATAYIYALSLPFAFLLASVGGGLLGGLTLSFSILNSYIYLMLFVVAQMLSFCGFSYISASYCEETLLQNRTWLFFKPFIIYLLLFLSFGFTGLLLLKNVKCFFFN